METVVGCAVMRRKIAGGRLAVSILIFAVGCGDSRGTARGVMTLQQVAANISVALQFPRSGGQARQGIVGIDVSFAEVGRALGSDCPIINADVQFGGVPLRAVGSGGSSGCGVDDSGPNCGKVCLNAAWVGDATTLLETMPLAVDLTLTDSSGQLTFTLDNPAPMATVEFAGLQDGQAVSQVDTFQFTINATPPLDQSSIEIPDPTKPATAVGFFAWMNQDGSYCHPYVFPGPPSAADQWALNFESNCADLTAGPAFLGITFRRPTALISWPPGTMFSGETDVDWKEVAVNYGN